MIVSYLVPITVVETAGLEVPSRGLQTQLERTNERKGQSTSSLLSVISSFRDEYNSHSLRIGIPVPVDVLHQVETSLGVRSRRVGLSNDPSFFVGVGSRHSSRIGDGDEHAFETVDREKREGEGAKNSVSIRKREGSNSRRFLTSPKSRDPLKQAPEK